MATDLVSRDWFGRFDSGEGESADLSCRFRKEEWHNLSGVLVKPWLGRQAQYSSVLLAQDITLSVQGDGEEQSIKVPKIENGSVYRERELNAFCSRVTGCKVSGTPAK